MTKSFVPGHRVRRYVRVTEILHSDGRVELACCDHGMWCGGGCCACAPHEHRARELNRAEVHEAVRVNGDFVSSWRKEMMGR